MDTVLKDYPKLARVIASVAQIDVALAFSAGVDSSLLLVLLKHACEAHGTRLAVYFVQTPLQPSTDLMQAKAFTQNLGVALHVLACDLWAIDAVATNAPDRCYHCKRAMLSAVLKAARLQGIEKVVDGTNHDDLGVYRPGLKALQELSIQSPLAEADLSKADIRAISRALHLPTAQKPATPCLATRFPYNVKLTPEDLARVQAAENIIKKWDIAEVRVRAHGNLARIEVKPEALEVLVLVKASIVRELQSLGFEYVTVDLAGLRSGSMDIALQTRDRS